MHIYIILAFSMATQSRTCPITSVIFTKDHQEHLPTTSTNPVLNKYRKTRSSLPHSRHLHTSQKLHTKFRNRKLLPQDNG